jgi:hypothetical protein
MASFTVRKGVRYRAEVTLGFFESFASNDTIADKLREAGFVDIDVHGDGRRREVTALWPGDDATAEIPPQVTKIVAVPDEASETEEQEA